MEWSHIGSSILSVSPRLSPQDAPINVLLSKCCQLAMKQKAQTERISFGIIDWKSSMQVKRGSFRILVYKPVVNGLGLERGMTIHSYLAFDGQGRPLMVSYLDGHPRGDCIAK